MKNQSFGNLQLTGKYGKLVKSNEVLKPWGLD